MVRRMGVTCLALEVVRAHKGRAGPIHPGRVEVAVGDGVGLDGHCNLQLRRRSCLPAF